MKKIEMRKSASLLLVVIILVGCSESNSKKNLPFLGNKDISLTGDTVYHEIEAFSFTNQDGEIITKESTRGKVYVADYFFSHCPTMCPAMTGQMKRVQKAIPEITILTHSCDPERDSVGQLKWYTEKRDIDVSNWHFLTGSKKALYDHGFYSYMMTTDEDVLAPGGFMHSPLFALIDGDHHIRGVYDGTTTESVDQLIEDAKSLIKKSK
jgi:protein SCO1/2